jgi:hypothetical protein
MPHIEQKSSLLAEYSGNVVDLTKGFCWGCPSLADFFRVRHKNGVREVLDQKAMLNHIGYE